MFLSRRRFLAVVSAAVGGSVAFGRRLWAADTDPDPAVYDRLVSRGLHYLRTSQSADGAWSPHLEPGVTAVVITGVLKTGRVSPDEPWVRKALSYLEKYVQDDGGIYPRRHAAYTTSVAMMAFHEANKDGRYDSVIRAAQDFLKQLQADEGEGYDPSHPYYGGIGYDSKKRPDLSNTQLAIEALHTTGLPKDDPAFRKALVFLSRCQNLASEYNTLPFAAKVNDGGFIYTPVLGGESKAGKTESSGWRSYGSMTYAGLKSMIYCGVDRNDPRIRAAVDWIRRHYTTERNPGMPPGRELEGLYYYYQTMAKALYAWGEDPFVDASGNKHPWRIDLVEALAHRQRDDGSWVNTAKRWYEGDPNLCTGYALIALHYARP